MKVNIAVIFMIIGVFLETSLAYSFDASPSEKTLRIPMQPNVTMPRVKRAIDSTDGNEDSSEGNDWEEVPLSETDPFYLGYKIIMPEALHNAIDPIVDSQLKGCKSILEVGSGTGFFYDFLGKNIRPKLTMLEQNTQYIREAVLKGRGILGENIVQGRVEKMKFKEDSFDAVIGYGSFDTVSALPRAIKEVNRVLCPGGIFISFLDIRPDPVPILSYTKSKGLYRWEGRVILTPELEELKEIGEPLPDFWYVERREDIAMLEDLEKQWKAKSIDYKKACRVQNSILHSKFLVDIFKERLIDALRENGFTDVNAEFLCGNAKVTKDNWSKRVHPLFSHRMWSDRREELFDVIAAEEVAFTIQKGVTVKRRFNSDAVNTSIQVLVITARKNLPGIPRGTVLETIGEMSPRDQI